MTSTAIDQAETSHAPGSTPPRPTVRSRLRHWFFGLSPVHKVLYQRAADLVEKINYDEHLRPDGVHVDVGSGTGHNSCNMARRAGKHNVRFICVDPVGRPTKRVLKHIKRKIKTPIEFVACGGDALPLSDDQAVSASIFFVLHHIPYEIQLDVLREIKRVLKPGGRLFIWEDTPENEEEFLANEIWDRRLNFEPKSEPHFYRSGDDWQALFDEMGFTLVERVYYEEQSKRKKEGRIRHTGFVLEVDGVHVAKATAGPADASTYDKA